MALIPDEFERYVAELPFTKSRTISESASSVWRNWAGADCSGAFLKKPLRLRRPVESLKDVTGRVGSGWCRWIRMDVTGAD